MSIPRADFQGDGGRESPLLGEGWMPEVVAFMAAFFARNEDGTAELTVPSGIGSGNDSKDFFTIKIIAA
jgi:hypothetical protein